MKTSRRDGLTTVEVLVVIAMIAVFIVVLLPAVQMAREASRWIQIKNDLSAPTTEVQIAQVNELAETATIDEVFDVEVALGKKPMRVEFLPGTYHARIKVPLDYRTVTGGMFQEALKKKVEQWAEEHAFRVEGKIVYDWTSFPYLKATFDLGKKDTETTQ